jgi:ferritin-like metal-binding protein YciE
MGLFRSQKFENLQDLLQEQLEDLYDAEQRIAQALPQMADAASSQELKSAFQKHLSQTEGQINRLQRAFEMLGMQPSGEACEAAKGLISEGEEIIKAQGDARVKDAGLIAAAQRVEHYEMAGYGTARSLAAQVGHQDVADLLQETLTEEGETDHLLTSMAEKINPQAAGA